MKKLICLFCCFFYLHLADAPKAQIPVVDYLGQYISKITSTVQKASEFINNTVEPFVQLFHKVQAFFQKAARIVRGAVKNIRLIEYIVDDYKYINNLYQKSYSTLQNGQDMDGDGANDFAMLDQWKHIQILLAISKETLNSYQIFLKILQDFSFSTDDAGRIEALKTIHYKFRKVKTALRIQLRRINKEIYTYRRAQKEGELFDNLFSTN